MSPTVRQNLQWLTSVLNQTHGLSKFTRCFSGRNLLELCSLMTRAAIFLSW